MEKNWLIRTKSNHILGPVSKEKALELYNNGSIKADDELCSGNGFWFYVREDDLVERYLKGNEIQGFNPISEAKDVLTQSASRHTLDQSQDEITLVGNVNLNQLRSDKKPQEPLAEVKPIRPAPALSAHVSDPSPKKKSKPSGVEKPAPVPREKKVHKSQNYLQYLAIIVFVILFCIVYFRKNLIQAFKPATSSFSSLIIPVASAQTETVVGQKKKSS